MRSRLRKLGFTFDGEKLSAFKADAFAIIDDEIQKLEAKKMKEDRKRG